MPDQVRALLEQRRQLFRLLLEVDPLERWPRRVAAAARHDHVEPLLQRAEVREGRRPVGDTAVHEDHSHAPDSSRTKSCKKRATERISAVTSSTSRLVCSRRWSPAAYAR